MPLELYIPRKWAAQRRQGPPKLVVTQAPNGRTTIRLSASVRDWLGPSRADTTARYPQNLPVLKVALLVDRTEGLIVLERRDDGEAGEGIYDVRGLGSSGSGCYISEWSLDQALGLLPGHYPAELLGTEMETSGHAVQIALSARTETADRARPPAFEPPISIDDEARIAEIRQILDEGVTVVE